MKMLLIATAFCLGALEPLLAWQAARQPKSLTAHAGELVLATVDQREIDLAVSVRGQGGSLVADFDGFSFGYETIAFIAPVSGVYTFHIRRVDGRPLSEPAVVAQRPKPDCDACWLAAARLATEAKHLTTAASALNSEGVLAKSREALQSWKDVGDRSSEARTLIRIGDTLYGQSRYAEADARYRESLRLAEGLEDLRIATECRNNAGLCQLQLGNAEDASTLLQQAIVGWRKLRFPFGESAAAVNLGLVSWRLGLFDEAREYYQKALSVFLSLHERRAAALARNNLGLAYSSLNKPALALEQMNQARAEFHVLSDKVAEGQALLNIGYLELLARQTDRAIRSQTQAVALLRDGPDVRAKADAMTNLSRALALRKPEEALRPLTEALSLYEGIGDRRGQASALHHLGIIHSAIGEAGIGLQELGRAFEIRDSAQIRDAAAESLFESGCILERQDRLDEAAERFSKVIEITETLRATAGGEGFRVAYFSSKQPYFQHYIHVLMRLGRPAEALAVAERARGRSLLDSLSSTRRRIPPAADPGLVARKDRVERQISYQSQQLLTLARSKPDSGEAALRLSIEGLFAERDLAESEIRKSDPGYDLWNPKPATLNEMQGLLDDQTALLEFALGETQSYLWVVTASDLRSFALPQRRDLEAMAREVVRLAPALRQREQNVTLDRHFRGALARLARQLFGGAADSLDRKRWVVVPDGLLHYVPFAAVRLSSPRSIGPESGSEIVVLPSASALSMLRRNALPTSPAGVIAIFADPVFDGLDPRVSRAGSRPVLGSNRSAASAGELLARLPYSKLEADTLRRMVPPRAALLALDFAATKAKLMSEASRYRILHLSTHAILDDVDPELSRIVLSQVNGEGNRVDGNLRLFEIYNLRLPATELVVLSACNTAVGQHVRGEGLLSLANGFFHAGARAVLATLWTVDDQASQELVRRFYEDLLIRRLKPAAALAAAQKTMRTEIRWRDPYYWAGFVLMSALE